MPQADAQTSARRRVLVATVIGTSIEWYDFNIYGIAAALVLGPQFFPKMSETASTLAAYSTFAVGFVARPFGAALFGHFGDRIGRKYALVVSILLVGLGTFCIGLLPTYGSVGVWAPILLVTCRVVQGIGVGGEWGGAALMAAEHAPARRRGFYVGWPQFGSPAGLLLANLVFFIVRSAGTPEEFTAFNWRIPFLLSIVLVVVGFVIRLTLAESPVFARVKQAGRIEAVPLVTVFRAYPKQVFLIAGAHLLNTTAFFLVTTYTLSYARTLPAIAASSNIALIAQIAGAIALAVGIVAMSHLSDLWGRKWAILPLYLGWIVWIWPMFALINTGALAAFVLAVTVGTFLTSAYGPLGAHYLEQFDTRVRYTGAGLAQYIGAIFGGGLGPLVATQLNAWRGVTAVQLYVVAIALVASTCVALMRDAARRDLEEIDDLDADPAGPRAGEPTASALSRPLPS